MKWEGKESGDDHVQAGGVEGKGDDDPCEVGGPKGQEREDLEEEPYKGWVGERPVGGGAWVNLVADLYQQGVVV